MAVGLDQLAAELRVDTTGAENAAMVARLLMVGEAMAKQAAPSAPSAIIDEAVVRIAGWLKDSPASGFYESQRGKRSYRLARGMVTNAVRSSGAGGLLLPWRVHAAQRVDQAQEDVIVDTITVLSATQTEGPVFRVEGDCTSFVAFVEFPSGAGLVRFQARAQGGEWLDVAFGHFAGPGSRRIEDVSSAADYRAISREAGPTVRVTGRVRLS